MSKVWWFGLRYHYYNRRARRSVAHIFISYATRDRVIADELSSWLRAAGHELFLDHDLRDGASVGEDWKKRLYCELREVDAGIGVVTSSFAASNWRPTEMGTADVVGCRLLPLRAEPGGAHPLMRDLRDADYQADPRQARDGVLQALRLLEDGGATWLKGGKPFSRLELTADPTVTTAMSATTGLDRT